MEVLFSVLASVLASVAIGLLAKVSKSLTEFRKEHKELVEMKESIDTLADEHEALMECNRNQNKNEIVGLYNTASARGYISPMELDCANRLADSYFKLGGNHYIHALIERMNKEMPVVGDPIPD